MTYIISLYLASRCWSMKWIKIEVTVICFYSFCRMFLINVQTVNPSIYIIIKIFRIEHLYIIRAGNLNIKCIRCQGYSPIITYACNLKSLTPFYCRIFIYFKKWRCIFIKWRLNSYLIWWWWNVTCKITIRTCTKGTMCKEIIKVFISVYIIYALNLIYIFKIIIYWTTWSTRSLMMW